MTAVIQSEVQLETVIDNLGDRLTKAQFIGSTAVALLIKHVSTMEVQVREGRGDYSKDDIHDLIGSMEFLNQHARKKYDVSEIKKYLQNL